MCAAMLKMEKRAKTSSTRSRDWCQLHTFVHASVAKAAKMCSTVRNAKESYNELHQIKALVPIAHIPNSATHARSSHNLANTCNSPVWPYLGSIEACTGVCSWHQSLDLVELVLALFFIFNNAAHIHSLSYFN